jgi:16S rRNA (guanine527-N7)-methyltransferase
VFFVSASLALPLISGLAALKIVQTDAQQAQLLAYVALLNKWNAAYNLTAIRDPQDMLVKHVFDALSVQAHLPSGGRWIDVGSGGGIPGLILAIADPSRTWTLLDSNGKKTRFLTQATLELGLTDRVTVVHARAEDHQQHYDGVIARAVTETADFIGFTQHLCADQGAWWLMKGQYPQAELAQLPDSIVTSTTELFVPSLDAQRWLIRCQRHALVN